MFDGFDQMLSLVLALLAGAVTVAAPCTLPMLPICLAHRSGQNSKARPAMIALGFVVSFSPVALLWLRSPACSISIPTGCALAAAILLFGFGLLMIWPAPFEWLSQSVIGWLRTSGTASGLIARQGAIGGFVLGTTLGLVWTPCAGPVLGSILTVVATSKSTSGRACCWSSMPSAPRFRCSRLPMAARPSPRACAASRGSSPQLQQGFGVVVIAFAIASYFQYDTLIVAWLTGFYPNGQIGL